LYKLLSKFVFSQKVPIGEMFNKMPNGNLNFSQ